MKPITQQPIRPTQHSSGKVQLFYAMKNMGRYTKVQKKICLATIAVIIVLMVFKAVMISQWEPTLTSDYSSKEDLLSLLGYNIINTTSTVTVDEVTTETFTLTFNQWQSLEFETLALLNNLLLVHYYNGQILRDQKEEPIHYIHHSEWLNLYMYPYYMFFLTLTVDTFFAQTIIQMVVLGFMYSILFLWATSSRHKNGVCRFVIVWIKRLLSIQLACIALTEIKPVLNWIETYPSFETGLFLTGFILDMDAPVYQYVTHIFLICFIICFGQLYEATYQNYLIFQRHHKDYQRPTLTETLLNKNNKESNLRKSFNPQAAQPQEKTSFAASKNKFKDLVTFKQLREFDYKKFVNTYMPYVCLWVCRIFALALAYAYHGYPAFLILTWLLLSFMIPVVHFVTWTCYIYLPAFSLSFFFEYFINIVGLFEADATIFQTVGRRFKIAPIEVGAMVTNLIFLLMLLGSKKDLQLQRNEFKDGIFRKLTDKNSNFLWQLCFYIFKRIHIPLLVVIFAFGLQSFNIFYIGLLYFFVMYVSSLATYRKSKYTLIVYASIFIWIQYMWSLTYIYFDPTGNIYKILTMITLQTYSVTETTTTTSTDAAVVDGTTNSTTTATVDSITDLIEYEVPVQQWMILMAFVFLVTVNNFFKKDKSFKKQSFENENVQVTYHSTAEFYEAKCDFILRVKFPNLAKILIKIQMIFSEMMIIGILIIQAFILVIQYPNILYWFFLIFSFTLQTAVVSASEENMKMLKRCVTNSQILKFYSGIVLIAQIAYTFITDDQFLAQYGFDDILVTILGGLNDYLAIIGLTTYSGKAGVAETFISPVLFYITACILEDYFKERCQQLSEEEGLINSDHFSPSQIFDEPLLNNQGDNGASPDRQTHNFARRKSARHALEKTIVGRESRFDDEDLDKIDEKDSILFEFEKLKFSIPYMIYQRLNQWRFFDSVALNFHLVTAFVTIYLCCNWEISLFMAFYLICTVILCIRAARALHKNGKDMQVDHSNNWNKSQTIQNQRNSIKSEYITKDSMNVDEAHQLNKQYMLRANQALLDVRKRQWNFQYWLLILSMIIMYPTPLLGKFEELNAGNENFKEQVNNSIYWLFMTGIYISPEDIKNFSKHAPLYVMLIVLICEKIAQRWQTNRYGCSIEKIREFKHIEEKVRKIQEQKEPKEINDTSVIPVVEPQSKFITIQEARTESERIESLYREQTLEVREKRLKNTVEMGIKRKYVLQFRTGLKFIMEQLSLQLLLFSCANKANFVSILYLGLLLMFLRIKNKTTGMLYMAYVFGFILATEYILSLTNLTYVNSPMAFPAPFNYYPCNTNTVNTTLDDGSYKLSYTPNCQNVNITAYDAGETTSFADYAYPFPWYLRVEFFNRELDWAMFFSIDIDQWQVNDIWFDFLNLALLTIYFFSFGNPINANNLKVSFSQTKSLEDALNEYSRIMMEKKCLIKQGKANEDGTIPEGLPDDKGDTSFTSRKAADDSAEYFLGSTYYLQELKKNIFIYYFTKKMRYFVFIGVQIFTIVMILLLALLCRSLMSIGYLIACVPLIWNITDFFSLDKLHQEGKQWKHPYIISGPLLVFSFVDISLQILCQIPYYDGAYWQRLFGFDKIFEQNGTVIYPDLVGTAEIAPTFLYSLNETNLYFLILKSINLFFIFLQCRIYQSEAFWKFMRVDLRKLMSIGNHYKKWSLTFRFNNWKLQKIITLQQRKKKMYEGVAELKMKIQHYQAQQKGLLAGDFLKQADLRKALLNLEQEDKKKIEVEQDKRDDAQETPEQIDTSTTPQVVETAELGNRLMDKLVKRAQDLKISIIKLKASKALEDEFKMSLLQDLLDKDDEYFMKKEAFKETRSKLGRCARLYLWLKKEHVNQIAFINDLDEASRVKKSMEKGYRTLRNDLEKTMIADINLLWESRKNRIQAVLNSLEGYSKAQKKLEQKKMVKKLQLDDMKKTQEFLQSHSMVSAVIGATFEALFSKCATLCYFAMMIAQMLNAGLVSILYPLGIFGYALMEETRPGKKFWEFMLHYTVVILFLKFACQLGVWHDFGVDDTYKSISEYGLFGLWRVEGIFPLFMYVLPEIMVLIFILGQIYYEILIGLWEQREIEVENISQAKERFLDSFNETQMNKGLTIRKQKKVNLVADVEELDEEELPYEQRIGLYPYELKQIKEADQRQRRIREYEEFQDQMLAQKAERVELAKDIDHYAQQLERKVSNVDDSVARHQIAKAIKEKRNPKKQTLVKRFNKNPYFLRLFPSIKQAKPGIDLYARITFVQFIICYYLIAYYTQLDARGTQNLENSSQFSIYMVIMIFIQTAVMILERYISRTNTRVTKKKGPAKQGMDLDDKYMQSMQLGDAPKSMTVKLQQQKTSDTILMNLNLEHQQKALLAEKHSDYLKITLEETKMTNQQVSKWIIQWTLLILYHLLVFWFFPLQSNQSIYGTPTCDTNSGKIFEKYGCYSFRSNGYLIIFYLLFCYYFMLSALQLRHGYPDWRMPSSLTQTIAKSSFFPHLGFYNLPFLIELKTILDWCWSKTSLDLFQWLELAEVNVAMFNNRNANKVAFEKPLGEKISRTEKCICGCFCLSAILFFLVGPFLFFSNLSSFSDENLVTDATLDFTLKIYDGNLGHTYEYPLFQTDSPTSMGLMPEEEFYGRGYSTLPETKFFDYTQVQKVVMMNSSDTEWSISEEFKETLLVLLDQASVEGSNIDVNLTLDYSFYRPLPSTAMKTSGSVSKTLNYKDDAQTFADFKKVVTLNCSDPSVISEDSEHGVADINIANFVPEHLRLTEDSTVEIVDLPYKDANLSYYCENYWSLNIVEGEKSDGLLFITFSDLISSGFFSQSSLLAFYVSVAMVVGTYLRKLSLYNTDRIFICDIPNSEPIRNLIQCIYYQRLEMNLKKEEELFFILFEILRSPELLKALVGSSLKAPLNEPPKKTEQVFKN